MQFCSDLYALEVTSDECLSKVRFLLSCPSEVSAVRDLQGSQAETFIEFLDRVRELCRSCFRDLLRGPNAGSPATASRRQIPAAGFTTPFQDLQSPGDHTRLVYSSTGIYTYRELSGSRRLLRSERRRIPGLRCGNQRSQDKTG